MELFASPTRKQDRVCRRAVLPPDLESPIVLTLDANRSLRRNLAASFLHQCGLEITSPGLPILNIAALTSRQLETAVKLFDEMCEKSLLPLHEIDKDSVRKELDERFAREVLGVPESMLKPDGALDVLRRKLAQEPSIRGNK